LQRGQVHELLAQSHSQTKSPENNRKKSQGQMNSREKAQKAQKIVSQAVTRTIKTAE
jgi:hypothetical protein